MSDGMSDSRIRERKEVIVEIRPGLKLKCERASTRIDSHITVTELCPWIGAVDYDEESLKKTILGNIAHAENVIHYLEKKRSKG